MRATIAYLWHRLTMSFWFVPGLALILAIALSSATLAIDAWLDPATAAPIGWLYGGGPAGARALLSTVAGAMITVASLVFSLTLVALTMATAQFGPRLLQTFMRDAVNQIALGAFLGTFVFALLVLRSVDDTGPESFVPHASTGIAVVLAVASFVWLIYFIHHVAESLQADTVIASVGAELSRAIAQFGEQTDRDDAGVAAQSPDLPPGSPEQAASITISRTGYVQAIDQNWLVETASTHDLIVRLAARPGDFLAASMAVAYVWPAERVDEGVSRAILQGIVVGPKRTAAQDVEFVIANLVEVALRALSPGVNDPHTAITCIDRLTAALVEWMQRPPPRGEHRDAEGSLRLVREPLTLDEVLNAAFGEIGEASRGQGTVLRRLVDGLTVLARYADRHEQREALGRHVARLGRIWRREHVDEEDARAAASRLRDLADVLRDGDLPEDMGSPPTSRVAATDADRPASRRRVAEARKRETLP